jgi:hypothetical protein
MSGFGTKYLGLDVTYNANNLPLTVIYYLDAGKTELIESYTMTYASGDHPIYLGETLYGLQFNVGTAEFVTKFSLEPSILGVDLNTLAEGVVVTGVNQFDIPWTMATAVNIGEYIPVGGTSPFTYAVTVDADNKFTTSGEFLQLDNSLNIFADTEHSVTVRVTDDNSKTFDILLTFTVVSGNFTNTYSFEFLDTTDESLISNNAGADATTEFSISIWYDTSSNNKIIGGRWDDSTDCHWYIGFDSARPRMWVSGDGSATVGANVQSIRSGSNHTSGVWQHVVFTFNAGTMHVYVNGVQDDGTTAGTPQASMFSSATQSMELGYMTGGNPGTDTAFDGFLDEFSFWDVELGLTQVNEIYNSGTPDDLSTHSLSGNLVEWYFLGDAATATELPEVTSAGVNELNYRNGAVQGDRSTTIPP